MTRDDISLLTPSVSVKQEIIVKLDIGEGFELHFFCESMEQARALEVTINTLPAFAQFNCNDNEYI